MLEKALVFHFGTFIFLQKILNHCLGMELLGHKGDTYVCNILSLVLKYHGPFMRMLNKISP